MTNYMSSSHPIKAATSETEGKRLRSLREKEVHLHEAKYTTPQKLTEIALNVLTVAE